MSDPGRRFEPAELTDPPGELTEAEVVLAAAMARDLEAIAERDDATAIGFSDRVMAAIATEPTPKPTRAFGIALRAGRLGGTLAALGDAWRVAFGGGRPLAVRGQAFALVLVVLVGVLGVTGGAAVGAARLLNPDVAPSPSPSPAPSLLPSPSPSPSPSLEPSPSPTPSASPTETVGPTESPESTDPGAAPTATDDDGETPEPTDDSSGSGSGDDNSGSGSSGSGSDDSASTDDSSGSGSDDLASDDHSGSD
jgi:hypothetical protein